MEKKQSFKEDLFNFEGDGPYDLYILKVMLAGYRFQKKFLPFVSNISKKTYKYVFKTASVQKLHPMRNLTNGTDRILISPNLIAIADHTG